MHYVASVIYYKQKKPNDVGVCVCVYNALLLFLLLSYRLYISLNQSGFVRWFVAERSHSVIAASVNRRHSHNKQLLQLDAALLRILTAVALVLLVAAVWSD
jgi:hypothetical protein